MANYCYNTINFYCDPSNAEVLEGFRKLIEDFCKDSKHNQLFEFAEMIEDKYGFKIKDFSDTFDGRDSINHFDEEISKGSYVNKEGNSVEIVFFAADIESAWSPVLPSLDAILKTVPQFSVISYEAVCEEPGMEIYVNTDVLHKFFDFDYSVRIFEDFSLVYEDFLTEEETVAQLESIIEKYGDDSNKAWFERTKHVKENRQPCTWISVMSNYIASNGLANLDYRDFGINKFMTE